MPRPAPMRWIGLVVSHFATRQFGVFLFVGGMAATLNFAVGTVVRLFSTSAFACGASVALGMAAGSVASFFLNRRYTFAVADQAAGPQAVRFAIVALGSVVLASAVAEGVLAAWQLAGSPWISRAELEGAAHVLTIGLNPLYAFLALKHFALKNHRKVTGGSGA